MGKREDRLSLLYKVAYLYYEVGKKKYEIGQQVKQSPSQVGNLLEEALREGIVKIEVNLPRLKRLEDRIKKKFDLRDVVIVPNDSDCSSLLNRLGQASSEYFEANVPDGAKVGLGGGYLMYEMINRLPARKRDIEIFPAAIIGRGSRISHIDPMILVTLLWARSGHLPERARYVTVTPLDKAVDIPELQKHYRQLLRNRKVSELFEDMKGVDWVFASMGGVEADEAYIAATNYATKNLLDEIKLDDRTLRGEGVVGDVVYSFFDKNGKTKSDWNLVPTVGVKQLKEMSSDPRKRVVITVGSYKMPALEGLMRGEICNVLITDALAAEKLLQI